MQISSKFQQIEIWMKGTHCADINYLSGAFLRDYHGLQKGLHKLFSYIMNIYNVMLSIFQKWALIRNLAMLRLLALLSLFSFVCSASEDGGVRATVQRGL